MIDYKKICANCVKQANIVVGLWEGIYEHSLNYGELIENPYDTIPLDDIYGGCKSINDICHDVDQYEMLDCRYMYITTDQLIRAFCEIIGEPYNDYYLSKSRQTFWRLETISGKYAFTLLEMWWVVNEHDHWLEKYGIRETLEKVVKEWYGYHINGGKTNLLHWMMGVRE